MPLLLLSCCLVILIKVVKQGMATAVDGAGGTLQWVAGALINRVAADYRWRYRWGKQHSMQLLQHSFRCLNAPQAVSAIREGQ